MPEESEIMASLRDEMSAQFSEMKASFEASVREKDAEIEQLKEQNKGLQRALVRSAVMEPPRQEIPKTQEQKYAEHIGDLAAKTLNYMLKR